MATTRRRIQRGREGVTDRRAQTPTSRISTKLLDLILLEIRRRLATGEIIRKALCEQAGISTSYLSRILSEGLANRSIPSRTLKQIVNALEPEGLSGFIRKSQRTLFCIRRGSDAPESFNNLSDDAITSLFLAGATEDIKRLEQKETVPYQRGKLECDVFTGKSTQMIGDSKFGVTWTILRHDDVPFGLAGVRMKMTIEGETELIQVDMRLQDFGKDAKATLPELTP